MLYELARRPLEPPQDSPETQNMANLTEKYLKQKVVPGLFQSSQATVLELWASPHVLGPPGKQWGTSWTQNEKIAKIIKITKNGGIHMGLPSDN